MTRYVMVIDLRCCVGCQTCTAACKLANGTPPGVQWRRVLDLESGEYPDVRRTFVPVGCMHCADPPCMHVCPTQATYRRKDGVVAIDYQLCIGCAYCAVACPYQARFKVERPRYAYGGRRMAHETLREDPGRIGVAQKCTFCIERIGVGRADGLLPGVAPAATPACVVSCIAGALHFGDRDAPESNVSQLLASHRHFRMHEELGTGPNLYYLWGRKGEGRDDAGGILEPASVRDGGGEGVAPSAQMSWDWRAAANFMAGGAGTGLLAAAALAAPAGAAFAPLALIALALVAGGLLCVWLEIGRPWRFLNVFLHPKSSWMTREAMAAVALFALAAPAMLPWPALQPLLSAAAAVAGLAFLYCQARILEAAKGIPAWREGAIVALIVSSGLAEGAGLLLALIIVLGLDGHVASWAALLLVVLLLARLFAWHRYRESLLARGAPARAAEALDGIRPAFEVAAHLLPAALVAVGLLVPALRAPAWSLAGLLALAGGWLLKHTIVTRAAYNQGFAIVRMPARGSGTSAAGIKPGWLAPRQREQA